jgi:hypothetical protein
MEDGGIELEAKTMEWHRAKVGKIQVSGGYGCVDAAEMGSGQELFITVLQILVEFTRFANHRPQNHIHVPKSPCPSH